MNDQTVKEIRQEIDQALKRIGQSKNLDIRLGGCTYGAKNASFKLKVNEIGIR